MPADFNDRTDFENADRGFIASIEPMTISDAGGRQVWDMDGWAFLEGTCPDTRESQPLAPGPAQLSPRPLRGDRRHQPGARLRPVEHDPGGERPRRHRDRPARLPGDGGGGAGPLPSPPGGPCRDGGHLHARPHRPLRGRARRGRRRHRGAHRGARALLGARRVRERVRRDGDAAPGLLLRRGGAGQGRQGHVGHGARPGALDRRGGSDRPHARHHPHRPGGGVRRRAHRVPEHPRDRVPRGDELLLPRPPCALPGRERHPQPAQPPDPAGRAGARPARSGRGTSRRRSSSSLAMPTSPSRRITGRPGVPPTSSRT